MQKLLRWFVLLTLLSMAIWLVSYPSGFQAATRAAISHWWTFLVPDIFASLLLVEGILWLFPEWEAWSPLLHSLASFPLVGGLELMEKRSYSPQLAHQLAWTNFYNPLLFEHPWHGVLLDLGLALTAYASRRAGPSRLPSLSPSLAPPAIAAMNATTLLGALVMVNYCLRLLPMPEVARAAIDPLVAGSSLALVWRWPFLAFNGIALVPLIFAAQRKGLPLYSIIGPRLTSALMVALMAWGGSGWLR